MVDQVWIIRHGETDWNVAGRWQGHADPVLNARGQKQAAQLARYLADSAVQLDAIYSSDLQRAAQTAAAIRERLAVPLHYDPRLREFNLGVFQGLTGAEIQERFPEEYVMWRSPDMAYTIPNGESRLMLRDRVLAAWTDITANQAQRRLVIVTHGGTIRHLLEQLFPDLPDFKLHNTSLTTLSRQNTNWQLIGLSQTPHLEAADF